MQPGFLTNFIADFVPMLFPSTGTRGRMPLRTILDEGIWPAFSSDVAIGGEAGASNPFATIASAVGRKGYWGRPVEPPHEAITVGEALRCHTLSAAESLAMSGHVGTIEVGAHADLITLDHDPPRRRCGRHRRHPCHADMDRWRTRIRGGVRVSAVVTLEAVGKTFGPVTALADVSFDIRAGEIHALMGENGAGKSTLIKVLAGIHQHSSGEVRVDDRAVRFKNPKESRSVGIRTVFQELSIVPSLTVAENVVLGEAPGSRAFVNPKDVRRQAAEALELLGGVELDLDRPARSLARSEQQLIEIARALRHQPRVLILDEPTASLGHEESRRLLTIVDGLRARGVAVLYVSHRMAEVVEIADRVTVLRDGRYVNTSERPIIEDELVERMIGRPAETLYQHTARTPPARKSSASRD